MFNFLILLLSIVLSAGANLLLKKGTLVLGDSLALPKPPKELFDFVFLMFGNLYILGGLASFGLAFVLWVWLLTKMQLNVFYPIALSSQIVLIAIASWFLYKETLTPVHILGMVIIIIGVFLLLKTG
ncbi:MAG: hypothetical protein COV29_02025 [Candidatus Yanofskybacteria bacterium CG10_big_fil_rev_8_21_14_0_10_36_16]|uniref:EamA domain-containing protein n=1 Tax=Candidatus Yanofskybacteria bacterium CG10_big_fil_rev_8_21_14_0_10_36_16 TaxID=1975096 RepID=A0A2J0Q7H5_9BACT|nr:MAG: hypothetical protein COV29_02025 [Candidatus Yanofskybacteria bacterium CG10_big_fil_rev_8_21_14_0_10_36_16]